MREEIRSGLAGDIAASSRKIDALVSGRTGTGGAPRQRDGFKSSVMPCTACAGSGLCPACHGRQPGCVRCGSTGICKECGGTGVL
jgi:hypothetical protein